MIAVSGHRCYECQVRFLYFKSTRCASARSSSTCMYIMSVRTHPWLRTWSAEWCLGCEFGQAVANISYKNTCLQTSTLLNNLVFTDGTSRYIIKRQVISLFVSDRLSDSPRVGDRQHRQLRQMDQWLDLSMFCWGPLLRSCRLGCCACNRCHPSIAAWSDPQNRWTIIYHALNNGRLILFQLAVTCGCHPLNECK